MDWLSALKNIAAPSAPAAQTTDFSTLAPVEWQQQVANSAGFNPLASGGGGVPSTMTTDPSFMQSMLGYTNKDTGVHQQGWGGMAIGGLSALSNAYMGMKQYGLAKEQFAESKRQYNQNYAAQRTLTNSQLEDRQRARVASNAGAYESVGSYMNRNGIK